MLFLLRAPLPLAETENLTECRTRVFLSEKKIAGQKSYAPTQAPVRMKQGRKGEECVSDLDQRIQAMHRRDVQIAWAFVIGLWLAVAFVAVATWSLAPSSGARTLLLIAGAIVLVFNTGAIMAMLRHYREDRDFMYGLDIKFLDESRAAKR